MSGIGIEETEQWLIGPFFSSNHPFFSINKHTVIYTWITIGIIVAILLLGRYLLSKKDSMARFVTMYAVRLFVGMVDQTLSIFSFNHFVFITSLFCFVFACNLVSIIPWMEEPTIDLNTTLALGIISFLYTQVAAIGEGGLWKYIRGYFSPFFLMMPINVVGKLATVVSISFRLFGNIFGGSIISSIYFTAIQGNFMFEFIGLASGLNLLLAAFFVIFEGFLQAFVFAMLSLTYLSLAIQSEGD
ncbi:F0F1 ATP synthase subunit A [Candidatus Dependentiae bacterium]|nr:MAG: F0F1 ATP synthase subunit A [Candidatus Dependentiae bacterium]